MAQIFPKWLNKLPLALGVGLPLVLIVVTAGVWYYFSPWYTDVGYTPVQPVPFSHRLHAGDLRIDCRYCHVGVERAPVASVPSTATCMNCHRLVGQDMATLEPLRASAASGRPLRWVRVHALPQYAYFDHSAHVRAGVGCASCHGDVAVMDRVRQVKPLSMSWCLDCHRHPAAELRPQEAVFDTAWAPPADQLEAGARLAAERGIAPPLDCSGCHR
ncbi:MAG: cytochrome c3 family protein [Thermoanaerobaculia bacterium]